VIFTNAKLVRGRSGFAGEIGHFCLHPHGLKCECGSFGCFEKYCSAKALELRAEKIFGRFISARDILELANSNVQAQICIKEYISDLSIAVGSLINIFNPEAIVFSGGLFTTDRDSILSELKTDLSKQGFQALKMQVQLLPSSLEGKAGIIGAATLGFLNS
jgi:predicted NBD/HSP70 family sugar kinase